MTALLRGSFLLGRLRQDMMENSKPVDRPIDEPSRATVKARQGTGPRAMVTVLLLSLLFAVIVGAVLLFWFLTQPAIHPSGT